MDTYFWHFLEQYVYRMPEPPPRVRTKPMEVLCVGLPRSGTESLQQALLKLGYDYTYHVSLHSTYGGQLVHTLIGAFLSSHPFVLDCEGTCSET